MVGDGDVDHDADIGGIIGRHNVEGVLEGGVVARRDGQFLHVRAGRIGGTDNQLVDAGGDRCA